RYYSAINQGDASFAVYPDALPVIITSSNLPRVADINNDGINDIVTKDGSDMVSALGTGVGFEINSTFGTTEELLHYVRFADINGDSFLDIIGVNNDC